MMDLVHDLVHTCHMTNIGVHEAKTSLSKLLRRVAAGEEITITRAGTPVARLVPVAAEALRILGEDAGRYVVRDDFDAPLPADVLDAFES